MPRQPMLWWGGRCAALDTGAWLGWGAGLLVVGRTIHARSAVEAEAGPRPRHRSDRTKLAA